MRLPVESADTAHRNDLALLLQSTPLVPFVQQLQERRDREERSCKVDGEDFVKVVVVPGEEVGGYLGESGIGRDGEEVGAVGAGVGDEDVDVAVGFADLGSGCLERFSGGDVALNGDYSAAWLGYRG
jgi:hypothetical protein